MLILKLTNERDKVKRVKGIFKRKIIYEENDEIKRTNIEVIGKTAVLLELPLSKAEDADVKKLLNVYKGKILVSEKYSSLTFLQDVLFKPDEYYQRAIISSLINQMKTLNKEWKTVCLKIKSFYPFQELFELVKISKKVALITKSSPITNKFQNKCYYEYGAVVNVTGEKCEENFDLFLNLDRIDNNGKLMVNVKGKDFLLYPDATYFSHNKEFEKLNMFDLNDKLVCAAFTNK